MYRIILSDRGTFLGKSSEQFRITRKDLPDVLIPTWGIEQIQIPGSGISVSSDAIQMADQLGVEVVFVSYYGKPLARLIREKVDGAKSKTFNPKAFSYESAPAPLQ